MGLWLARRRPLQGVGPTSTSSSSYGYWCGCGWCAARCLAHARLPRQLHCMPFPRGGAHCFTTPYWFLGYLACHCIARVIYYYINDASAIILCLVPDMSLLCPGTLCKLLSLLRVSALYSDGGHLRSAWLVYSLSAAAKCSCGGVCE